MVRRLTNQQVVVLAAIERLGSPMLVELRRELPALGMSTIYRRIEELQRRGLVVARGSQPRYAAVPRDREPGHEVPGVTEAPEAG